jgi:hypothetical protein
MQAGTAGPAAEVEVQLASLTLVTSQSAAAPAMNLPFRGEE